MFNLFKRTPPVNKELEIFQNSFSPKQKCAIVAALMAVAKSDGKVSDQEVKQIESIVYTLNANLDDPFFLVLQTSKLSFICDIIKTLDKDSIDWFVISIHGIAICDANQNIDKVNMLGSIIESVGITKDEYIAIITKAQLLMKKFNLV